MSDKTRPVIRITSVLPHENADSLEVIPVGGYTVCARLGQFHAGDLAVYLEPDDLLPVRVMEFSFLEPKSKDGYAHIKAIRLRGVLSYGLLVAARPGWVEGQDVAEELGVRRWEPPIESCAHTEDASAPGCHVFHYDIENYRRYAKIHQLEAVEITEKINGANARFVWTDGELHVGSHTKWKKPDERNQWWQAAKKYDIESKLQDFPEYVFYGELYGNVGGWGYGQPGVLRLAFFDVSLRGEYLDVDQKHAVLTSLDLPEAPVVFRGLWTDVLIGLAQCDSLLHPGHIREGVVVSPLIERRDPECGRVKLKIINPDYLAGKKR